MAEICGALTAAKASILIPSDPRNRRRPTMAPPSLDQTRHLSSTCCPLLRVKEIFSKIDRGDQATRTVTLLHADWRLWTVQTAATRKAVILTLSTSTERRICTTPDNAMDQSTSDPVQRQNIKALPHSNIKCLPRHAVPTNPAFRSSWYL